MNILGVHLCYFVLMMKIGGKVLLFRRILNLCYTIRLEASVSVRIAFHLVPAILVRMGTSTCKQRILSAVNPATVTRLVHSMGT